MRHVRIDDATLYWKRGDSVRWVGTNMALEVFPGLFWDDGEGLGTYFAKGGTTHHCHRVHASELARVDCLILSCRNRYEYHTGGMIS